jgi:dUTP pyrophosphatase
LNNIDVKIKKLSPTAVLPVQAHDDDACYDLFADSDPVVGADGTYVEYKTGLSIQPQKGWHSFILPRSSITKTDLVLANSVGVIDSGYRGELVIRFKVPSLLTVEGDRDAILYKRGDRIAQIMFFETPKVNWIESETLSETTRGAGGLGSTGK